MNTKQIIKQMEKEFDKEFPSRTPLYLGYPRFNRIPRVDDVKSFIKSYTRTLLESFGEEIIPTEFKLKGRDEAYIRGFNDGHKYAVGEQRLKVKEIIEGVRK